MGENITGKGWDEEGRIYDEILRETIRDEEPTEELIAKWEGEAVRILAEQFGITDLTNTEFLYLRNSLKQAIKLHDNNAKNVTEMLDQNDPRGAFGARVGSYLHIPSEAIYQWFEQYLNIDIMNWQEGKIVEKAKEEYEREKNENGEGIIVIKKTGEHLPDYLASYLGNKKLYEYVLNLRKKRQENEDDLVNP